MSEQKHKEVRDAGLSESRKDAGKKEGEDRGKTRRSGRTDVMECLDQSLETGSSGSRLKRSL